MRARRDRADRLAGFDAFVAERGDALVAVARGLCARDEDAEDLLERALATVVRRWRRPAVRDDPDGATVRELVRLAGRGGRGSRDAAEAPVAVRGEADLDELAPDPPRGARGPGATAPSAREDPVAALRAVPVEQRAVLLLRWLEGCDDAGAAAVLGIGEREAGERARAALDAMGLTDG